MKFLNGFKTYIGLAGMVAAIIAPRLAPQINEAAPHVVSIAEGIFGALLALGVIHKVEKAQAVK